MITLPWIYLFVCVFGHGEILDFEEWHGIYGRNANHHSHQKTIEDRRSAFNENIEKIKQHNSKGLSWRMGVNQFSDLTSEEFGKLMSFDMCRKTMNTTLKKFMDRQKGRLPQMKNPRNAATVDWRSTNNPLGKVAVTAVKNQGSCGSCWSFSTTGSLEGANVVAGHELVSLSEQQLVSCDKTDSACQGGLMDYAFEWIESNGGITSEAKYPYVSGTGYAPACDQSKTTSIYATVKSYHDVTSSSVSAMETALNIGPVSIAIEADQSAFQSYSSGVFTATCGTNLDHGVLAVGYGHDSSSGLDYWIMKNSWATSWGMDGYMYMDKSYSASAGQCGILLQPSYPVAGDIPSPGPGPTPAPGPTPTVNSYEDPGASNEKGCNDGETPINNVYDIAGRMCMPTCPSSYPYDCAAAAEGWPTPGCVMAVNNNMYCGFSCDSDGYVCPGGTVCTDYYGFFKVCMYQ